MTNISDLYSIVCIFNPELTVQNVNIKKKSRIPLRIALRNSIKLKIFSVKNGTLPLFKYILKIPSGLKLR